MPDTTPVHDGRPSLGGSGQPARPRQQPTQPLPPQRVRRARMRSQAAFAWEEFFALPLLIVGGFLLAAVLTLILDETGLPLLAAVRERLSGYLFRDRTTSTTLLSTVATGTLTVASITFSLLLLAVQQTAASLTSQVFNQFLRRRENQLFFGYFVGLAAYSLIELSSAGAQKNPVWGAALSLLLALTGVLVLLRLVWSTVNQMRPEIIVEMVHDHLLAARERQRHGVLAGSRQLCRRTDVPRAECRCDRQGYVDDIDVARLSAAAERAGAGVEVELLVSIGDAVSYHDLLAVVRADRDEAADEVAAEVLPAVRLLRQRAIDRTDPGFGLQQLELLAWRSVSTAQQNPVAGLAVLSALHDVTARWAITEQDGPTRADSSAVVYRDDVFHGVVDALESIAVASFEGYEHRILAADLKVLASLIERAGPQQGDALVGAVDRIAPTLQRHVGTRRLLDAVQSLTATLDQTGRTATADRLRRHAPAPPG